MSVYRAVANNFDSGSLRAACLRSLRELLYIRRPRIGGHGASYGGPIWGYEVSLKSELSIVPYFEECVFKRGQRLKIMVGLILVSCCQQGHGSLQEPEVPTTSDLGSACDTEDEIFQLQSGTINARLMGFLELPKRA